MELRGKCCVESQKGTHFTKPEGRVLMCFQTDGIEIGIDSQSRGLRRQASLRTDLGNDE